MTRITPAEITARRMLMIECKRSQDAAMVGQMQADIAKLREALADVLPLIEDAEDKAMARFEEAETARAILEATA